MLLRQWQDKIAATNLLLDILPYLVPLRCSSQEKENCGTATNLPSFESFAPDHKRPIRIVPLYIPDQAKPAAPQLVYNNRPLLTAVQVLTIFWGSAWQQSPLSDTVQKINAFHQFDTSTPGTNNAAAKGGASGPPAPPRDALTQLGDFYEAFDFSQGPNYHPPLPTV